MTMIMKIFHLFFHATSYEILLVIFKLEKSRVNIKNTFCHFFRRELQQGEVNPPTRWWMTWPKTSYPRFRRCLTRTPPSGSTPPLTNKAWTLCWYRKWCASTACSASYDLVYRTSGRPSRCVSIYIFINYQ